MYFSVFVLLVLLMHSLTGHDTLQTAKGHKAQQTAKGQKCIFEERSSGLKADCSGQGLTKVPRDLPEETVYLDLSDNSITALQNSSLPSLPNLKVLDLTKNSLTDLESGTLFGLHNLQQLLLSQNNVGRIKENLLRNNQELNRLTLAHNKLTEIPMCTIRFLKELDSLDMSDNIIQFLNFTGLKSKNLSSLILSRNKIKTIFAQDFYPLENVSITTLSLSSNNIKILPRYTFSYLKHVTKLYLTNNHIESFSLAPFSGMISLNFLELSLNNISRIIPVSNATKNISHVPKIRTLFLDGNYIPVIPPNAFEGLEDLEILDLSQCHILSLQNDSFAGLSSLQTLRLMDNKIKAIQSRMFTGLPCLQTLILSNNGLTTESAVQIKGLSTLTNLALDGNQIELTFSPAWDLPALPSLDLSRNDITRLISNSFLGLTNLTNLTLAANQIATIPNNAFGGLQHLQKLDLSAGGHIGAFASPFANLRELIELNLAGTSFEPSHQTFLGLDSLRNLYMSRSSLNSNSIWDSKNNVSIFSTAVQLESLSLSWNSLNNMHPCSFHPLAGLQILRLEHCLITTLHPDIFRNLSSLTQLNIDYNNIKVLGPQHLIDLHSLTVLNAQKNDIKHLSPDVFSQKTNLYNLDISNNAISWIEEGTTLPMKYLDISNNPLSCDCDLTWFREELDKRNITLGKPDQTICSLTSLKSVAGQPLLNFQPEYLCGPNIAVIVSTSILLFGFLLGMATAYRKRWWLSYKCFHVKLWLLGYEEFHDGREHSDYLYDINIVFDEDDDEWVKNTLKPGIQEYLPHLNRIAYGDRDLPLDMFYMDAVIYIMENSYKTVLVVSENAIHNHHFITKLRQAIDQMNDEETEKALLVFKDDIPQGKMPYLVRLLLSENKPYLLWNDEKYAKRLFWEKFNKNMLVNKKMNDLLPV